MGGGGALRLVVRDQRPGVGVYHCAALTVAKARIVAFQPSAPGRVAIGGVVSVDSAVCTDTRDVDVVRSSDRSGEDICARVTPNPTLRVSRKGSWLRAVSAIGDTRCHTAIHAGATASLRVTMRTVGVVANGLHHDASQRLNSALMRV